MTYKDYPAVAGWSQIGSLPELQCAAQYVRGDALVILSDGEAYVCLPNGVVTTGPPPCYTVEGDLPLACLAAAEHVLYGR